MPEAVVIHAVTEARPDFRWKLDTPNVENIDELIDRSPIQEPLILTTDTSLDEQPTFSMVDGLPGVMVAKLDEDATPGVGYFSYFQADIVSLGGDAEGSVLILPPIGTTLRPEQGDNIDSADPSTWPFKHNGTDSGFFRVAPFEEVLLCGQWIMNGAERIIDIERNSEMEFPDWVELTGASGLVVTEVWRYQFDDNQSFEDAGPSFVLPPPQN